jgi:polyhydroxyalkanoate synthesis regulator phasin
MIDLLKKTIFTGIGLAYLSKEKVTDLAKSLSENLKLSGDEGEKLAQELLEKSSEAQKDLNEKIQSVVDQALAKADVARQSEVQELLNRIEALENPASEAQTSENPSTDSQSQT